MLHTDVKVLLTDLPVEVILKILEYLEVRFITEVLSMVSTLFRDLAEDETTWKCRIQRRWRGQYPALPPASSFNWTEACIAREEENLVWSGERSMVRYSNSTVHYASVDAVHVIGNVVASGSRDRSIHLWPLGGDPEDQLQPLQKNFDAHKGWVWCFSSVGDTLISGAWDSYVNFWKITPSGMTECRPGAKLKTAVLTTDIHENRIAAGTFDNKVVQLDVRESTKKMTFYKAHSKPVLKVIMTPTRILSLSEDSTLVVHDRVAAKRLKRIAIPSQPLTFEQPNKSFPLSMDLLDNMLYLADSCGTVHLLDTTDDLFEIVQTYKSGHTGRVTSLVCGRGSYMSSGSDATIRIHQPSRRMELLSAIKVEDCGQVTGLSYGQGVLAAGGSNNCVNIWKPSNI